MLGLDTNVLADVLRSKSPPQVRQRFEAAISQGQRLLVSSVVVHELMFGALKTARSVHHMERLDDLLARLEVVEFTADDAIAAARVRSELEGAGRGIGPMDTLLAGQAIARGWTFVTRDLKDFLRVEGLIVIDWTRSDQPLDRQDMLAQMLRRLSKDPK